MKKRAFIKALGVGGLYLSFPGLLSAKPPMKVANLSPLLVDQKGNPIRTLSEWKKQRKVIEKRWLNYLGALKANPSIPRLKVLSEDRPEGLIRQLVEYEGEPGMMEQGYLIRPEKINGKLPGVVALHSTSDTKMEYIAGVKEGKILPFGYRLAKMGFVVFCPMCFLWRDKGDRDYVQQVERFKERHPYSKGMAKMLFDAQRAVDVLVSLKEVDANRIGSMGHSLGAKEALYLSAFDNRVKVTVSNEGGVGVNLSNWDDVWYLEKAIHTFGHDQHEVLALSAPKPFFLIGGDDADGEKSRPFIEAVLPVYDLYGNKRQNLELYNHGQGHMVTPEAEKRTYEWIVKHL